MTEFTIVYKTGNEIRTYETKAHTAKEALSTWNEGGEGNTMAVLPTQVFEQWFPDASVFFGIFPF